MEAFGVATRIDDGLASADVDDCLDDDAGPFQVSRDKIGAVVVCEDDGSLSRSDAITVDVGPCRAGQHDPRSIVVREDQRPLVGPGREYDALRSDLPEAAAVRQPLRDQYEILLVMAEGCRAREQPDIRLQVESGETRLEPVGPSGPQPASAQLGLLIDPGHAGG